MDLNLIDNLQSVTGFTLNTEEYTNLEASIIDRKISEQLNGKVLFWGKIFAKNQDYLVVVNISNSDEFLQKKFYFWYVLVCVFFDYIQI